MAPGGPVKIIKVHVPRHHAQRIGSKLGTEIKSKARSKKIRIELYQPSHEITQAVESASEWNSLLITARAERGPQWDVGTQQFLVDRDSELYYDPTPLLEAVKQQSEAENAEEQQQQQQQQQQHQQHQQMLQQQHQAHSRHHTPRNDREFHMSNIHHPMGHPVLDSSQQHRPYPPSVNYHYPSNPPNMGMGMRTPNRIPGPFPGVPGGTPFNAVPPNQFFPNESVSPMRMGPIGGMGGMGMDHGHGIGHPIGGMAMGGGGMTGMPMNMGPDMGRRVTRGMVDEGFPMH